MALTADQRRRGLGMIFLSLAGGMLLCGQTILAARLDGIVFVIYWLICFACTVIAILIALADLRALQERTRRAQRELVRETFGNISEPPTNDPQKPGSEK